MSYFFVRHQQQYHTHTRIRETGATEGCKFIHTPCNTHTHTNASTPSGGTSKQDPECSNGATGSNTPCARRHGQKHCKKKASPRKDSQKAKRQDPLQGAKQLAPLSSKRTLSETTPPRKRAWAKGVAVGEQHEHSTFTKDLLRMESFHPE